MNLLRSLLVGIIMLSLFGCAADDPNRRTKTGATIGAVTGAILGHQVSHEHGAVIGAVAGAVAGGAVGNYMDEQEKDFDSAMAEEQRQKEIEMERLKDDTLKLTMSSEVSFDYDSAAIKPAFSDTLDKLGDLLRKYDRTIVHVIGHTDSRGTDAYNQSLSERRARAVMDYLVSRGVPAERLRSEGRGEREPRDTNATEAGRQLNRRVEVYMKPIVEGQEQKAYESPQYGAPDQGK